MKRELRYKKQEVEQAIQWVMQYNPYAKNWTTEFIRNSIMDSLRSLSSKDIEWTSTGGYTILKQRHEDHDEAIILFNCDITRTVWEDAIPLTT